MHSDPEPQNQKTYGWSSFWDEICEHCFEVLSLVGKIFFRGSLFVLWIALDAGAEHLVEYAQTIGLHEVCAHAFRWIASIAIFVIAATPAVSDVLERIGAIRKKTMESWNMVCRTCPARQHPAEVTP